jgi:hypothetical protein
MILYIQSNKLGTIGGNSMEQKPSIVKGVLCVIPAGIVFALTFAVSSLVITFAGSIILKIPIIGSLVKWLFLLRGDSPYLLSCFIGACLAYFITLASIEKMLVFQNQRNVCANVLGIAIMVIHILCLVLNLIYGESFAANIAQAIAGYLIFRFGK